MFWSCFGFVFAFLCDFDFGDLVFGFVFNFGDVLVCIDLWIYVSFLVVKLMCYFFGAFVPTMRTLWSFGVQVKCLFVPNF